MSISPKAFTLLLGMDSHLERLPKQEQCGSACSIGAFEAHLICTFLFRWSRIPVD
uniref:Uncharacterized protein n=1 Tax=Physcomitrium patens TaxID=3218 RepID=A0A2K1IRS2_PHYPA|nr:hypothetical protein PHYPA_026096 [Physcomitrium patens]